MKADQFSHPFREIVESFLIENQIEGEQSFVGQGKTLQYAFCLGQTTCTIRLQYYNDQNFEYHWIQVDYGIGSAPDINSCCFVKDISQYLVSCNYPFRVSVIPDQRGQLLILNFRADVELLTPSSVYDLISSGFELAANIRDQFQIPSIFKKIAA